jgi:O-methyltransferase
MGHLTQRAFQNTENKSLLYEKIHFLEFCCEQVIYQQIEGDILEAGVYKGGSARLLATAFPNKKIFLFDSFEGMTENDLHEAGFHKKGDFSDTSLESVKLYLNDLPNCNFYKGWLPESANILTDEKFCFIHLDMDLYQSTKTGLELFWPRLNEGGIMVLDDWEWYNCPGVKKAALEFFSDKRNYTLIVEPQKGSCAFIKHK